MTNHPNRNPKFSQRLTFDGEYPVGHIGFLVRTSPQQREDSYVLSQNPAAKNQSGERVIYGWCGSWNNTSTSGCGIAVVTREFKNCRVQVGVMTESKYVDCKLSVVGLSDEAHRAAVQQFLDETGYADEFDFSDAPVLA